MQFMKQLTERKLALIIIAASLFILFQGYFTTPDSETISKSEKALAGEKIESVDFKAPGAQEENVIYTCRLGDEEIPAVQIAEVKNADGQVTETVARVDNGSDIKITATGAAPRWDYKSVSAGSGESVIKVAFSPLGKRQDSWMLTLKDENTYLNERVKDCMEVSEE
jgi:hypothetical protein